MHNLRTQGEIKTEDENAIGFSVYYIELNLIASRSKVFIDFVQSNRNNYADSQLVAANFIDKPLKQIRIYNDGGADFIRVGINGSQRGGAYIKIKSNSSETIPFVDVKGRVVLDVTLMAEVSNSTVRIIGLG